MISIFLNPRHDVIPTEYHRTKQLLRDTHGSHGIN